MNEPAPTLTMDQMTRLNLLASLGEPCPDDATEAERAFYEKIGDDLDEHRQHGIASDIPFDG